MSHERPVEPFSDIHFEDGRVEAVLLHDPTVEGLDMAIYMDASASMTEEYRPKRTSVGLLDWLRGRRAETLPNDVEPQVHWMLEYLATKDRNGKLRVAYWACGEDGSDVQVVGELEGKDVKRYKFPGPAKLGSGTVLTPALRDYVAYVKSQVPKGARRGCAVIVTDGEIHDADDVKVFSAKLAKDIVAGKCPRTNFVLVGVGDQVDEEQLEEIAHEEYKGVGHLWCHRHAQEIKNVAEIVAVLVDETMTVAAGGTIYDDREKIVKTYEGRLPAVLEFEIGKTAKSFTLEVNGQRYTQPLPEDDDHEGEEH
ncbi:MAG TPA: vWA domain-containing protein [Vicinamibacteria bacterium]|nr:vWA domain-containing protein [Vicinamibacteria bacterium]